MSARQADGLIIGGGPAGATLSRLLADRGHEVIPFELDEHPRFCIGESLLPMNLPMLERLGVADEVAAIGVRKRAPTLPSPMPASITRHSNFATRWGHPDHAFEVRRASLVHWRETRAQARARQGAGPAAIGEGRLDG